MRLISRKPRNKKKKVQVKDNIKKATIELLAEKGYASVSTRDIAKRADTAVGQLTYYYKTKDSLILEVLDEIIEKFILDIEEIAETNENKMTKLRGYFFNLIDEQNGTTRIIIDLISQSLYSRELSVKSKNMIDRLSKILSKVIMSEKDMTEEESKIESEKYINYFLGAIIRNNIEKNMENREKYAFNSFKGNKIKQKSLSAKVAYN